jgi:gluconolactonase
MTVRLLILSWIAVGCGVPAAVVRAEEHDDLPPTHSVDPELYATGLAFAEAPALDPQGNLYLANYRFEGTIGRVTPDGTASIWCDLRKQSPVEGRQVQATGLKVDSEGRLIVADAGAGRLLRVAASGQQVEVLADRGEGTRFSTVSDVALDLEGNVYFTDAGVTASEKAEKPLGAVYRYDIHTKRTSRLVSGLEFPKGLAISPDQQRLCVAETQTSRILVFDLDARAGTVENQRVLIAFPRETRNGQSIGKFVPDGMVFDDRGRLFVAMWQGAVVNVVELSTGKVIRQYDAGGPQATNCHFFGPYLYVTVAAKEAAFRLKLHVPGHDYTTRSKPIPPRLPPLH